MYCVNVIFTKTSEQTARRNIPKEYTAPCHIDHNVKSH